MDLSWIREALEGKGIPASGLERVALCPASLLEEWGYRSAPGEAAKKGDEIHKCVESEKHYLEHSGDLEEDDLRLVEDFREIIEQDHAEGWDDDLFELIVGVEYLGRILSRGRIDRVSFRQEKDGLVAQVDDWKTGRVAVTHASKNLALKMYAVGIFQAMPEVKGVLTRILAPRQYPRKTIGFYSRDESEFDLSYRDALGAVLRTVQGATSATSLQYNPGPKQCAYCLGKGNCSALQAVQRQFTTDRVTPDNLPDPDLFAEIYDAAAMTKKHCDQIVKAIEEKVKNGVFAPGFDVVQTRGSTKIPGTTADLFEKIKDLVEENEYIELCKHPTQSKIKRLYAESAKAAGLCKTLKAGEEMFLDRVGAYKAGGGQKVARVEYKPIEEPKAAESVEVEPDKQPEATFSLVCT